MGDSSESAQSLLGRLVTRFYRRLPMRDRLLTVATRLEGGQFRSSSLRRVLREHWGVDVGMHSYGSLLTPGNADDGTTVGSYVSIGPNVRRLGAAHPLDEPSMHPYWYNPNLGMATLDDVARTPCWIGHDAWIGANVTILPGCRRIGIGAVVGAGSIVTRDVKDFAVVVGNPARQISARLDEETRQRLLDSEYWTFPPERAGAILAEIRAGR